MVLHYEIQGSVSRLSECRLREFVDVIYGPHKMITVNIFVTYAIIKVLTLQLL